MRILILAPADNRRAAIAHGIFGEFRNFGVEIETVELNSFYDSCGYFRRKIYKLGYRKSEKIFERNLILEIAAKYEKIQPDFVLVLDGANIPLLVQQFLAQYKIILWLWDSYRRFEVLKNFVQFAAEIFCFEYEDVASLREKYKVPTHYLPLGANEKIYYPAECERDIDISFVGWTSKKRLEILEAVCGLAVEKNLSVKIGGPFHDGKYFWKKYIFGRRQKNLARFLENRMFEPSEVAELYRRSKICLNINVSEHHSLNPRTFEICATKSFQLMDGGQNSHGLINLETDLATFDSTADLLEKIPYYLANDELREKIATSGYNAVIKNCTLKKSVEKILAEIVTQGELR